MLPNSDKSLSFEILTSPAEFILVKEALEKKGLKAEAGEIGMLPATQAELDVDTAVKVLRLIDSLDDLDDTQNVFSNAEIPAEAYELL